MSSDEQSNCNPLSLKRRLTLVLVYMVGAGAIGPYNASGLSDGLNRFWKKSSVYTQLVCMTNGQLDRQISDLNSVALTT